VISRGTPLVLITHIPEEFGNLPLPAIATYYVKSGYRPRIAYNVLKLILIAVVYSRKGRKFEYGFRNVVRLGYVSLFTDMSTEMILGVLPFFIVTQVGGTAAILGFIEGVAEATNNTFRVFAGILTDKIGKRKPLVLLGYGLSSIAKPLLAVTSSWGQVLSVRLVDRAGKGIRTSPRDALISDSIAKSKSGRAFGLHQSLDQLGAVLGPLLAFIVIPLVGIRGVFWLSFVPAFIALVMLIFFVTDTNQPARQNSIFKNVRNALSRRFVFFLAIQGIFAVGAYNFSFILLKAGSLGIQEDVIPLVYASVNLATVVIGLPAGLLADRVGKFPVLAIGFTVFLVTSMAGLLLKGTSLYAFLIALLFGSYLAITITVQRAVIPDFTTEDLKGTAYAFYYMLIGVCSFASNLIFGVLWSSISPETAFQYSIVTAATGLITLIAFMIKYR
jgi:MFS family permease